MEPIVFQAIVNQEAVKAAALGGLFDRISGGLGRLGSRVSGRRFDKGSGGGVRVPERTREQVRGFETGTNQAIGGGLIGAGLAGLTGAGLLARRALKARRGAGLLSGNKGIGAAGLGVAGLGGAGLYAAS